MTLTQEQLEELAAELEGTYYDLGAMLRYLKIGEDPDTVQDQLGGVNLSRCPGCGLWLGAGEDSSDYCTRCKAEPGFEEDEDNDDLLGDDDDEDCDPWDYDV